MHCFITGGAGFIGSSLADQLVKNGYSVTIYDNFSTGQGKFLEFIKRNQLVKIIKGDLLDQKLLSLAMQGADFVYHLAANADVRFGLEHPRKDLEQNTIATFNVLEAMKTNGIRGIAFSSTGSVYGEPDIFPTPEDAPFPAQTSLYGASKLACEGLISAYCEGFGLQGWVFRFVSVLGERYSHGHVFDFYKQLLEHPDHLHVLGNGLQKKSYMYIQDCIDAMLLAIEKSTDRFNIFNLGSQEYCQVNDSIRWINEYLGLSPELSYAGGERGWIGDSPFILLDTNKIQSIGWNPKVTIREGIIKTLSWLEANRWILDRR